MIVEFKFDKEKDLYNIWETCNDDGAYGYDFTKRVPKKILKICKRKKYSNKCKKELMKELNEIYSSKMIKFTEETFSKSWLMVEKEYFKRLEKISKRKFSFRKVYCYLTTAPRCPYRPDWRPPVFYVEFFGSILNALHVSGHELMHIHLYNTDYWKKIKSKIGKNKTQDLKEALTELLNLEFSDLWFVEDRPYPNHIQLREFIKREWRKEKDFEKLIDNSIQWIKKNGVK